MGNSTSHGENTRVNSHRDLRDSSFWEERQCPLWKLGKLQLRKFHVAAGTYSRAIHSLL